MQYKIKIFRSLFLFNRCSFHVRINMHRGPVFNEEIRQSGNSETNVLYLMLLIITPKYNGHSWKPFYIANGYIMNLAGRHWPYLVPSVIAATQKVSPRSVPPNILEQHVADLAPKLASQIMLKPLCPSATSPRAGKNIVAYDDIANVLRVGFKTNGYPIRVGIPNHDVVLYRDILHRMQRV